MAGFIEFIQQNWALFGIGLTLLVVAGIATAVISKYVRIISNIFQDAPMPLAVETRDYVRREGEEVEFHSFDGHRLTGVLFPSNPDRPVRGVIVFANEVGSDKHSACRYCSALMDAGYEVFAFDFRGEGTSAAEEGYKTRIWPSDREQTDVLGAIAYVEDYLERQGREKQIGLAGISRGAGAVVLGAVGVPSVKAVMIDSGYSSDAYLEYLMQKWVSIFAKVRLVYENHHPAFWRLLGWLSIRAASKRLNCRFPSVCKAIRRLGEMPLLVVHGEKDGHIPVAQARLLYALAMGPKYIWICPGAKHNQSVAVQPDLYNSYSVRFFDQYLGGVAHDDPLVEEGILSELAQPLSEPSKISYSKYTKPERVSGRSGRCASK